MDGGDDEANLDAPVEFKGFASSGIATRANASALTTAVSANDSASLKISAAGSPFELSGPRSNPLPPRKPPTTTMPHNSSALPSPTASPTSGAAPNLAAASTAAAASASTFKTAPPPSVAAATSMTTAVSSTNTTQTNATSNANSSSEVDNKLPPPSAKVLPKPQRTRNVSWGDHHDPNIPFGSIPSTAGFLKPNTFSPALSSVTSPQIPGSFDLSPTPSGATSASPSPSNYQTLLRRQPSQHTGTRHVTVLGLDEVLRANPLETEAETLILNAIEDREGVRSRLGTDMSAGYFNNIPPEAMHIFAHPPPPPVPHLHENAPPTTVTSVPSSGGHSGATSLDHPPLPRPGRVERVPSQRPPPPPPQPPAASQIPKPSHRRTQTVEETLFGLTSALAGMHVRADPKTPAAQLGPTAALDTLVGEGLLEDDDRIPASSGTAVDQLAQNAQLIFRGGRRPSVTSTPTASGKSYPSSAPGIGHAASSDAGSLSDSRSSQKPSATQKKTGADRWHTLRTTVQVSQMLDDVTGKKKKDDDLSPHHEVVNENDEEEPVVHAMDGVGPTETAEPYYVPPPAPVENGVFPDDAIDVEGGFLSAPATSDQDMNNNNNNFVKFDDGKNDSLNKTSQRFKQSKFKQSLTKGGRGMVFDFRDFVSQRQQSLRRYIYIFFLVISPAMSIALILYYFAGNPPTGRVDREASGSGVLVNDSGKPIDPTKASASYWILFFIRQIIVVSLARMLQVVVVDFLCLSTRVAVNLFGHLVTLLVVQSRGWPFHLTAWGLLGFGLVSGTGPFPSHWLFWQEKMGIFNERNPSGDIVSNQWNHRVLAIAVSVGILVSFKRLWLGLFLGRKTFAHYAEDLAKVMKKVLLLCQVAALARDIEWQKFHGEDKDRALGLSKERLSGIFQSMNESDGEEHESRPDVSPRSKTHEGGALDSGVVVDENDRDPITGGLSQAQKMKISELLGDWEEPDRELGVHEKISISSILQFRQSLSFIEGRFMFSLAWGDVSYRENMVLCSQEVYRRLLLQSPDKVLLGFEVIAQIALLEDGTLNTEQVRDLVKLLRPDRDGSLSLIDFVKSVDAVYKEAKTLSAAIRNNEKIDRALEGVINVMFYTLLIIIILSQIGYNPLALFLSLSSIVLAFAFMIGSASSKMFEGILFILLRRPYDIGDRIAVSNVEADTSPSGSSGWLVKDVTLFYTTVVFGTTGERATLSNGSLASSRVINMARSPKALLYVYLKFPTNVPYERIQIFEQALREFVKARPRQWGKFSGFRSTQILTDLGYIEYVVVLQHRDSWQNIVALLASKAEISSFCLELSKKLDMRYTSPPLPVDLAVVRREGAVEDPQSILAKFQGLTADSAEITDVAAMFDRKSN